MSFVHPSAVVEEGAYLGEGCHVWHFAHVRKGAKLGKGVSVGKDSYVDTNVEVGEGTRSQNHVNVYLGVNVGRWCFIGPAVVFTNDQLPRAGNKGWKVTNTRVADGASIGAGAVIRCGVNIGSFSMIGAGALVTKDVAPFTLVIGHPAGDLKRICACGQTVLALDTPKSGLLLKCCEENMSDETRKLAIEAIAKI